jgi:glyoxylase-like metal-dependent hydrolase (beta-lactamase superfamily II)
MTPLPATMHVIQRDWLSCNQVLFFDDDRDAPGATLVDSGYAKHAETTVALVRRVLERRGRLAQGLRRLVNTHLHSDHCGGNAAIVRAFGCPVYVPAPELDAVRRWDEDALTFAGTGQRCERFHADGGILPGQTLLLGGAAWDVHAAPGHDPHSLILHCPEHRLLVSADALWENGFGVIFPELDGESGFAEQRAVLELIAALQVDFVIPGHGAPFGDVRGALDRAMRRLDAMQADPARNARNALRVLIKFLLLDRERVPFEALAHDVRDASVLRNSGRLMGMELREALEWGVRELEAQGQLVREGGWLVNRDP